MRPIKFLLFEYHDTRTSIVSYRHMTDSRNIFSEDDVKLAIGSCDAECLVSDRWYQCPHAAMTSITLRQQHSKLGVVGIKQRRGW